MNQQFYIPEDVRNHEYVVWKGGPSQLINLRPFMFAAFIIFVVLGPLEWAWQAYPYEFQDFDHYRRPLRVLFVTLALGRVFWRYLVVLTWSYELTNERLRESFGVFSRSVYALELYRVKDSSTFAPVEMNMFGYGHIVLHTSDRSSPFLYLYGIKDAEKLRRVIANHVEEMRMLKGVREVDV